MTAHTAVELFSTSILSNHKVRSRHERYTGVFAIKKIPYIYHDLASDEDAKTRWRRKAKDAQLPGILVNNEWRGNYDEFEEAVEFGELETFLGIDAAALPPPPTAAPEQTTPVHAAQQATSSKDPSLYPTIQFAPEGSGKRAELTAEEFIASLGLADDSLTEADADALLASIGTPEGIKAAQAPKKAFTPSPEAAVKPLRLARMGKPAAGGLTGSPGRTVNTSPRSPPVARYSISQRSGKALAAEASALVTNRKTSGALLREAVSSGKNLDEAMEHSKMKQLVSDEDLDNLFASLGLKDAELGDDELEAFLADGAVPEGLQSGGSRLTRSATKADKIRDEVAAREVAQRAREKGFTGSSAAAPTAAASAAAVTAPDAITEEDDKETTSSETISTAATTPAVATLAEPAEITEAAAKTAAQAEGETAEAAAKTAAKAEAEEAEEAEINPLPPAEAESTPLAPETSRPTGKNAEAAATTFQPVEPAEESSTSKDGETEDGAKSTAEAATASVASASGTAPAADSSAGGLVDPPKAETALEPSASVAIDAEGSAKAATPQPDPTSEAHEAEPAAADAKPGDEAGPVGDGNEKTEEVVGQAPSATLVETSTAVADATASSTGVEALEPVGSKAAATEGDKEAAAAAPEPAPSVPAKDPVAEPIKAPTISDAATAAEEGEATTAPLSNSLPPPSPPRALAENGQSATGDTLPLQPITSNASAASTRTSTEAGGKTTSAHAIPSSSSRYPTSTPVASTGTPPLPRTASATRSKPHPAASAAASGGGPTSPTISKSRRAIDVSRPHAPEYDVLMPALTSSSMSFASSSSTKGGTMDHRKSILPFKTPHFGKRDKVPPAAAAVMGPSASEGKSSPSAVAGGGGGGGAAGRGRHQRTISEILREADAVLGADDDYLSEEEEEGEEGEEEEGQLIGGEGRGGGGNPFAVAR